MIILVAYKDSKYILWDDEDCTIRKVVFEDLKQMVQSGIPVVNMPESRLKTVEDLGIALGIPKTDISSSVISSYNSDKKYIVSYRDDILTLWFNGYLFRFDFSSNMVSCNNVIISSNPRLLSYLGYCEEDDCFILSLFRDMIIRDDTVYYDLGIYKCGIEVSQSVAMRECLLR